MLFAHTPLKSTPVNYTLICRPLLQSLPDVLDDSIGNGAIPTAGGEQPGCTVTMTCSDSNVAVKRHSAVQHDSVDLQVALVNSSRLHIWVWLKRQTEGPSAGSSQDLLDISLIGTCVEACN